MAYTSIIPVHRLDNSVDYVLNEKKASRSQNADSLQAAVDYVRNKDKTEQELFCSAIGCTLDTAFADMCQIKKMWHKEKGVQGFHLVQSFAAGEVTPELAHRIGQELADRLLGGKFQVVISTHLNTGHIHNHLVWNSVSIQTGKKYRSNEKSYVTEVRRISDELCQKYHLSIIDTQKSERVARPYAQWLAEQENRPTWKAAIRQDIDEVISEVITWSQFLRALENRGYALRLNRKYITLQPPGKERPVRFKTLGKDYTPDAICRRILYPQTDPPAGKERPLPPALRTLIEEKPARRVTSLQALYVVYLFQVGVLPTKPVYISYAVREDIRKLDQRIAQVEFILKNGIQDRGQLDEMRCAAEGEIDRLLKERRGLYRRDPGSPRIQEITARLKEIRRTAKLCRDIEEHSLAIEQRLLEARKEREQHEAVQQKKYVKRAEKENAKEKSK